MSHIPSSAMKHAGPTHHDGNTTAPTRRSGGASADKRDGNADGKGIGTGAWIAIGGTLLAGAAAAIAVPLLKARATPVPTRRGNKATPRKAKAGSAKGSRAKGDKNAAS